MSDYILHQKYIFCQLTAWENMQEGRVDQLDS